MELELLKQNEVINLLNSKWGSRCDSLWLTGGAVIDILDGRKPKDYDFVLDCKSYEIIMKEAIELGLEYKYSSATSITFDLNGDTLQILRISDFYFPFTIEKSLFSIKKMTFKYFDEYSFKNKILIPNDSAYSLLSGDVNFNTTKSCFRNRVKKWESKGYSINKKTKSSYLKICKSITFFQKLKDLLFSVEDKDS